MSNELILYGEKVVVYALNQSNVRSYLDTYKKASPFSGIYEIMPYIWDNASKGIKNYVIGEMGRKTRYLIADKESSQSYGYVELEYSNPEQPEVDIAIIEEYRRKGYAFEAAKILLEYIFEKEPIKCAVWNAFPSNRASCRIAEKLGGTIIKEKNMIAEAMFAAGFEKDSVKDNEIPKTVSYEIREDGIS